LSSGIRTAFWALVVAALLVLVFLVMAAPSIEPV